MLKFKINLILRHFFRQDLWWLGEGGGGGVRGDGGVNNKNVAFYAALKSIF